MGSELTVSMVISVNGVVLMDVSSLANCVSYSLRSASNFFIQCLVLTCDEVDQTYLVVPFQPLSSEG